MTASWHRSKNNTSFLHRKEVAPKNDDVQSLVMTV